MNNNFGFNNMDDIFNQLMGNMGGFNSETRRYRINGREVTPEEFNYYRQTGHLPNQEAIQDGASQANQGQIKQGGILANLGRNLTEEARQGKLDPVIGRNQEIQDTAEILARRTKNNPVLVGDAGVGKTAVVEGLAQAIVAGDVPAAIKNKEIISIDISGLEAGTQYRGAFEENIQKLMDEVKQAGNIILFFDEIHQILGAGSTGDGQGSKGLADIIKPALSRGELTVIGATTQDEYRNTILKNAALARRFNEVKVNAPSAEDTFAILQGIKPLYEQHHNVELPDSVLKAAVDYSIQYMPQRALPDKAIDLVDVTAAHLAAQHPATDVKTLEAGIAKARDRQQAAADKEDYEAALAEKVKIDDLQKQIDNHTENQKVVATVNDVAQAVERMTGIPVSQMGASDIERLKEMGSRLKGKVIGQDEAVQAV
ncbi:AAA family ATPase, partial [Streptococcus sobrinus]